MAHPVKPKSVKIVVIGNSEPTETRLLTRMFADWESLAADTTTDAPTSAPITDTPTSAAITITAVTAAEIHNSFLPAHLQRRT